MISANDNEYFIIAESDLTTWSASGTLVLTGAYRETFKIIGQECTFSAETQSLIQNAEDGSFLLFMTPKPITRLGPFILFYTFSHTQRLIQLLFGIVLFQVLQFVILNRLKLH